MVNTLKNNKTKRALRENERLQADLDAALSENQLLKLQLHQLNSRLTDMSERPDDDAPAIVGDEIVVRLYDVLTVVSEGSSDYAHSEMCKSVLQRTPEDLIDDVRKQYINEGLDLAINLCKSKAEQAWDLESEVTALTAESIAEAIDRLKKV